MNILEKLFKRKYKTGNQLNIVHPYMWFDQWVFDDPDVDLVREPFVAGADTMLSHVTKDADRCTLVFSKESFPTHNFKIKRSSIKAPVGTNYIYDTPMGSLNVWLCPALFKYFKRAPKNIYFEVKNIKYD
mgnify:CR=1 FL=1|tara:strand:+ start:3396 stop:3785 length:390 start_codon:yes stop_codon:yes gene_type:complete